MTTTEVKDQPHLTHRFAQPADADAIIDLMQRAIEGNMKAFLSPAEIEAAKSTMGIDWTLIEDGTYFLVETVVDGKTVLVGCGGWGKRRTLYGGAHTAGRDDTFSDPATEPARIRAMYTHPDWTRCGIGTLLLELGEAAAREAGFNTIELGATLPGEPFYRASGYRETYRENLVNEAGIDNIVIHMTKSLTTPDLS